MSFALMMFVLAVIIAVWPTIGGLIAGALWCWLMGWLLVGRPRVRRR